VIVVQAVPASDHKNLITHTPRTHVPTQPSSLGLCLHFTLSAHPRMKRLRNSWVLASAAGHWTHVVPCLISMTQLYNAIGHSSSPRRYASCLHYSILGQKMTTYFLTCISRHCSGTNRTRHRSKFEFHRLQGRETKRTCHIITSRRP